VVVISVTLVGSWGEAAVCASLTPALTVAGAAGYAFPGHVSANASRLVTDGLQRCAKGFAERTTKCTSYEGLTCDRMLCVMQSKSIVTFRNIGGSQLCGGRT
jgi:hypothetical protein